MAGTKAVTNPNYIVSLDSSIPWETDVIDMTLANGSLAWQFSWDAGVIGTFTCYASIFPDPYKWETMVSCEPVTFSTGSVSGESNIISLPNSWELVGFLKWGFVPVAGSIGNVNAAIRVNPK